MQQKIEELCPQLTSEEISQVVSSRWASTSQITTINYTFDLNSIPETLKNTFTTDSPKATIKALSSINSARIDDILRRWQTACNNKILFNYVEKLDVNQKGITITACENLSKGYAITYSNHIEGFFQNVFLCLPDTSTNFDLKAASHEIGHALGLEHFHDVASITKKLSGEEGQICTVMVYTQLISTPQNNCTNADYCLNESYAVYPGPMDSQVCTALYDSGNFSLATYNYSLVLGFLNGSMNKAFSSLLGNLQGLKLSNTQAEMLSNIPSLILRSYLSGSTMTLDNSLALLELIAQLQQLQNAPFTKAIQLTRVLTSISSILFSLYQSFSDETILAKSIYMSSFLLANIAGSVLATSIGDLAANLGNKLTRNLGSFFTKPSAEQGVKAPGRAGHSKDSFFVKNNPQPKLTHDEKHPYYSPIQ